MKFLKIMMMCALSALLFSCNGKPDNVSYGTKVEFSHFAPQGAGQQVLSVYDTTVLIQPTWSQAIHFGFENEHWSWPVFQILFLLLAVGLFVANAVDWKYLPEWASGIFWIAIFGFAFLGSLFPYGNAKWNNNKYVPKAQFDNELKVHGTTQAIWDSLDNGFHIEYGKFPK